MTARLSAISIDADRPGELAEFWARALRWELGSTHGGDHPEGHGAVEVLPTDVTSFRLLFRRSATGKPGQNRIHFDLTTRSIDDQRDTVAELLSLGAAHIDIGQDPSETHVVLADPEGNELCIIEPTNRFLASCPRLGAVNCDGTRALGHFYSAALGWPLVWDQDEETAIQSPDGTGPKITWSGPPLMPAPDRDRLHLHLCPDGGSSVVDTVDRLIELGARRSDRLTACLGAIGLRDVDGNEFCVVER